MTDNFTLKKIELTLEEFRRSMDKEVSTATMLTFLHVAMRPGITIRELMDRTGVLDQGNMNRITDQLADGITEVGRTKKLPYKLITKTEDPDNHIRKVMRLTHKGRTLAAALVELYSGKK